VTVQGAGGSGRLAVDGMAFDEHTDQDVLEFTVDATQLQGCLMYAKEGEDDPISMKSHHHEERSANDDDLLKPVVLTRKLKAVNKGNLPLTVQDFHIGHWRWFVGRSRNPHGFSLLSIGHRRLMKFFSLCDVTAALDTASRSTTATDSCCSRMKKQT
jgi:hypothetical protein